MVTANLKAFAGLIQLFLVMAAVIFLTAWTHAYWQVWIFLAAFFGPSLAITFYLMKHDPRLLERRITAGFGSEKERSQNIIQGIATVAFLAMIIIPALDHRFGWSAVPAAVVLLGDLVIVVGFYFVFLVFKENTFASGIIEVAADQRVITTGPYALVRHPMYSGALFMLIGVPIALGSWWGLLALIPMALVLVIRLLDEEKFLAKNLAGYSEYQTKVKYRLLPLVW